MWIDDVTEDDYSAILDANGTAIPHVNSLSRDALDDLAGQAFYFRAVRNEEGLMGILLALSQDAVYGSPNFNWFRERYTRFVYIDRIVVAASVRRGGIGRALYTDLERRAAASAPLLACEVNIDPPNPGSMAFHERFGFAEVGRQYTDGGIKLVRLMVKRLPASSCLTVSIRP